MSRISENQPHLSSGTVRRLHFRWRLAVMLPVMYLLCGVVIAQVYFDPHRGGKGFLPLPDSMYVPAFFVGFLFVFAMVAWDARLRRVHELAVESDPGRREDLELEHQLHRLALCDTTAGPGIILFLINGDTLALVVFVALSLGMYLRVMPRPG